MAETEGLSFEFTADSKDAADALEKLTGALLNLEKAVNSISALNKLKSIDLSRAATSVKNFGIACDGAFSASGADNINRYAASLERLSKVKAFNNNFQNLSNSVPKAMRNRTQQMADNYSTSQPSQAVRSAASNLPEGVYRPNWQYGFNGPYNWQYGNGGGPDDMMTAFYKRYQTMFDAYAKASKAPKMLTGGVFDAETGKVIDNPGYQRKTNTSNTSDQKKPAGSAINMSDYRKQLGDLTNGINQFMEDAIDPSAWFNSIKMPTSLSDIFGSNMITGSNILSKIGTDFSNLSKSIPDEKIKAFVSAVGSGNKVLGSTLNVLGQVNNALLGTVNTLSGNFFDRVTSGLQYIETLGNRIAKMAGLRLIRQGLAGVQSAINEGIGNLYQYSAALNGSFSQAMDNASTMSLYFKNTLAAALAPALEALIPIVNTVANAFIYLMNIINQVLSFLGGKSKWTRAIATPKKFAAAAGGAGDGLKKAGNAAKGARKEIDKFLASWDELHLSTKPNSSGGSGGGAGGGGAGGGGMPGYASMFEDVPFDSTLKDLLNKGDWEGIGELFAEKLNTLIDKGDEWINKKFAPWASKWAGNIADLLNGFIRKLDWTSLGNLFGDGLMALINAGNKFLTRVEWVTLGQGLGKAVLGFINAVNWYSIGEFFANKLNVLIDTAYGFFTTVFAKPSIIINAITNAVQGWFENIHWDKAGQALTSGFNGAVTVLEGVVGNKETWALVVNKIQTFWDNVDLDVSGLASALSDFVINAVNSLNDSGTIEQVGYYIGNFFGSIKWGDLLKTALKAAWSAIKGAWNGFWDGGHGAELAGIMATIIAVKFAVKIGVELVASLVLKSTIASAMAKAVGSSEVTSAIGNAFKSVFGSSTVAESVSEGASEAASSGASSAVSNLVTDQAVASSAETAGGGLGSSLASGFTTFLSSQWWLLPLTSVLAAISAWSTDVAGQQAAKDATETGNKVQKIFEEKYGDTTAFINANGIEEYQKIMLQITKTVNDAKSKIDSGFKDIKSLSTTQMDLTMSEVADIMSDHLKDMQKNGKTSATDIKNDVNDAFTQLKVKTGDNFYGMDTAVSQHLQTMLKNGQTDSKSIRDYLVNAFTTAKNNVSLSSGTMADNFASSLFEMNRNSQTDSTSIKNWLINSLTEAKNSGDKNMSDYAKNMLKYLQSSDKNADKYSGQISKNLKKIGKDANYSNVSSALNKTLQQMYSDSGYYNSLIQSKLNFKANVDTSALRNPVMVHGVGTMATGGFPSVGEMFIAREAGPEMVGTIGGHTAVANNQDIVAGITNGVRQGLAGLGNSGSSGDVNLIVELDGEIVYRTVVDRNNQRVKQTGKSEFSI